MDKFGRKYTLEVQGVSSNTVTIELPITVEFDITRNTLTSANVCKVRIYNLSLKNRNDILKNVMDFGEYRFIKLKAGYGKNLPIIFTGNYSQAFSVREGVNYITQVECFDGGYAFVNGRTSRNFGAGTALKDVIKAIMGDLPGIEVGAVGSYPGTLDRGRAFVGNPADLLRELTGGGFFIDNGKAYALGTTEFVQQTNGVTVINSSTGLLGTPLREQGKITLEMIFEPGLNIGHKVHVDSSTAPPNSGINGDYKVVGVKHRGMISEAVCGSVITTVELLNSKLLDPVQ